MHNIDNFYDAWWFVNGHPAFFYKGLSADRNEPGFSEDLTMDIVKVNPITDRIDDDEALNTKVRIWLECGGWMTPTSNWERDCDIWVAKGVPCHDPDLDCGGDTFEDAIVNLAALVMEKHGDYNDYSICSHCLKNRPIPDGRDEDDEWFCSTLCEAHGPFSWHTEPTGSSGLHRYIRDTHCEHFPIDEDD